ncbi:hypothetical protein ACFYW6_17965 [Streptomyces sp. NPDC002659]|uniref:hypothetical protein n=1 Tax=Streptomyces sp. NPDC002659 TaxID=3364656 RepID=UPI0036B81E71
MPEIVEMTFHRATVLGSARDACPIVDDLWADGLAVDTWLLPADCTAHDAAVLAGLAALDGQWARRFADIELLVTVFQDAQIPQAILPYVLPHLPIGSVWLHMGQATEDETKGFAKAADGNGISFLSAQLGKEASALIADPYVFASIGPGLNLTPGERIQPQEQLSPRQFDLLRPWENSVLPCVIQRNSKPLARLARSLMARRDPIWDQIGTEWPRRAKAGYEHSPAHRREKCTVFIYFLS